MVKIDIQLFSEKKIGEAKKELYSSFIEHMGRAIYSGIYEPDHVTAQEDGFRRDVVDLVKDLSVSYVRYPGGNFVSEYHWKDGIGDKSKRPVLPSLSWHQMEPNLVGIDEFLVWCELTNTQPILAVNMGTGTPQEAFELLQYCNGREGYWAELRKQNGHPEPYNIKYWCIGNEMDGEWQIGNLSAEAYAEKAKCTAKMMKAYDPSIKLIACGNSSFEMPSFPQWDRTVLRVCFDYIDYISCHRYYQYDKKTGKGKKEFIGAYQNLHKGINTLKDVIREVCAEKGVDKPIKISMDEWNIWYCGEGSEAVNEWTVAVAREETKFSRLDAAVFASLISTLHNNTDMVDIACLAQLVNVIAPIFTIKGGEAIKQTIYYPFGYAARYMKGDVLACEVKAPEIDAGDYGSTVGGQASVVRTKEGLTLLYSNLTDSEQEMPLTGEWTRYAPSEHMFMSASGEKAGEALPSADIVPERHSLKGNEETLRFAPYSWNLITLKVKEE